MNANELRIGNLVLFADDEIREVNLTMLRFITNSERLNQSIPFEPIELTEEWLTKFGFISNRRLREKQFKSKAVDGDVRLTLWIGTNGEGFYYADCVQVKYVHQLQNLYFAISGEELTIS